MPAQTPEREIERHNHHYYAVVIQPILVVDHSHKQANGYYSNVVIISLRDIHFSL